MDIDRYKKATEVYGLIELTEQRIFILKKHIEIIKKNNVVGNYASNFVYISENTTTFNSQPLNDMNALEYNKLTLRLLKNKLQKEQQKLSELEKQFTKI